MSHAVAHHFDDAYQQHEAATLGMWAFLATEVLFFGGLFAGFIVYRHLHGETFIEPGHHLDVWAGAVNTGVLLISSLTMALAVRAAQLDQRRALVAMLVATMVLAGMFLGVKGYEYHHKYEQGLVPGAHFRYQSTDLPATELRHAPALADRGAQLHQYPPRHAHPAAELFFGFYFLMTGLHALHMVIGVGVMVALAIMSARGRFAHNPNFVEMSGLYWHFVDIVWIFLFPLLYLSHY